MSCTNKEILMLFTPPGLYRALVSLANTSIE